MGSLGKERADENESGSPEDPKRRESSTEKSSGRFSG